MDVKQLFDFSGKTVVVTGASQGIGAGIAKRFAEAGAQVIIHYRGNQSGAGSVVNGIVQQGGRAVSVRSELSTQSDCHALIKKTLDVFGSVDVMINNAGSFPNAALIDLSLQEWRAMYQSNVETAFLCTQAAAHIMKNNNGGAIVNIGSISGLNPGVDHSHYNSAKAAVLMLTRSAAQELGQYNIRVNAVSPGLVYRENIEEQWPEGVARWQEKAPLKRMGTPEDIANACLFFSSPASAWITGQNLAADGGMMSSMIY